jgi:hypothetical protein
LVSTHFVLALLSHQRYTFARGNLVTGELIRVLTVIGGKGFAVWGHATDYMSVAVSQAKEQERCTGPCSNAGSDCSAMTVATRRWTIGSTACGAGAHASAAILR